MCNSALKRTTDLSLTRLNTEGREKKRKGGVKQSMSEVAMYDEELTTLEDQVADLIRAMDKLGGEQRLEKYKKAEDMMKRVNKVFHQLKVEVRMLEGGDQAAYEKKRDAHNSKINQLKDQLSAKRAEANSLAPAGVAGGGAAVPQPGQGRRGDGKDEARDTASRIGKTQNETLDILREIEETIGVAKKLQAQTDCLVK